MITALTVLHILASIFLILIVLLQHGKGADMGASFGGASQTVFGASSATNILHKMTVGAVVIFMVTSLSLATLGPKQASKSVFDGATPKAEKSMSPDANTAGAKAVGGVDASTTDEAPAPAGEKKSDEKK